MKQKWGPQVAAPALAVAVAVIVSSLMLQFAGYGAGKTWSVILTDGFDRRYLVEMINRAGPYYIAGVAVAIGFKMNLFNIGVEGQYKIAALVAAWAGAAVHLPAPLHVAFILGTAMLTGALWALIPGVLKATRGVSEVIATIMLNAIAVGLGAYLLENHFRQPPTPGVITGTATRTIDASGRLPSLNSLLDKVGIALPPSSRVQSYVLVAVAVGILYRTLVWRTRFGYDLRATGSNAEAAEASGVDAKRMIVTAMICSGAIAGLIGLNNITGQAGRYSDVSVFTGIGFTGIAIALLGRNHPVGIAFAAVLWAFMDAVQTPLATAELPKQITAILQGIIVLSVVIAYEVVRRITAHQEAAALRRDHHQPEGAPEGAPA